MEQPLIEPVVEEVTTLEKDIVSKEIPEKKEKKLSKKQVAIDEIFTPDEQGISEWVSRDILKEASEKYEIKGLELSGNGDARHGIFFGDKRFIWEKEVKNSKTVALRTVGFSDDHLYGHVRPIRDDIHEHHKAMGCVVCGKRSALVTDHKNDLYNDPRVLNKDTQIIDDFQCLCNSCNLQKREVVKKMKETKKRYGATNIPSMKIYGIDFISGDETFDPSDVNAMVGTYWYDVVAFHKHIADKLHKS